jgi:hypothetical protein
MIFITAKFRVKSEHADDWPQISREFTDATRGESGCLWFDWSRSIDDPSEYVPSRRSATIGPELRTYSLTTSRRPPGRCRRTSSRHRESSTSASPRTTGPNSANSQSTSGRGQSRPARNLRWEASSRSCPPPSKARTAQWLARPDQTLVAASVNTERRICSISSKCSWLQINGGESWTTGSPRSSARQ